MASKTRKNPHVSPSIRAQADQGDQLAIVLHELERLQGRIRSQTQELRSACHSIDSRRAEYHRLAGESPWPVLIVDRCGVIAEVSKGGAELLEARRDQIVGRPLINFISREHWRAVLVELTASRATPATLQIECDIRTFGAKTIPVIAACRRCLGESPAGLVRFALTDISTRKRWEIQLQEQAEQLAAANLALAGQSEQLRRLSSQLVRAEQNERRRIADLLHDHVQQLLVACKMRLDILMAKNPQIGGPARDLLDILQEAVEALRSLSVELRPPGLHERGLSATLSWLADWMAKKHRLSVELDVDPVADRLGPDTQEAVFQAVRELLFNVVKHAGVLKARLSISPANERQEVFITVQDEGVGMDTQRIWASKTAGVGIPSMRERLHALGANLQVDSAPGRGMRATIRTKLEEPAQPGKPASSHRPQHTVRLPRGRVIRVLIADDHALVRRGIGLLLQFEVGMEVVAEAGSGREAVEMARQHSPDVILMDVNMPEMNGIEATRQVKEILPDVCVIGLSMHAESALAEGMRQAGADGYVSKVAPSDELLRAIRQQLGMPDHHEPAADDSAEVLQTA